MSSALQPIFLAGLALLLSLPSTTLAQENQELGRMWTFENPPLTHLEEEYGFKPTQEWLDALRLGSLGIGDEAGSASFVSPEGLILTSSRSVRDVVARTLDAGGHSRQDDPPSIIKTGFVAASPEREIRLRAARDAWLTAAQLIKVSNVTAEVNRGVAATDSAARSKEKREANKNTILATARKADPTLEPQIVSLYRGGAYQLYQYKVYDDVRLVILPHLQTAYFGGETSNFTYPRYNLDFAFLRAYEDGKPADTTKHYFAWRSGGAQKDELVFVSGNPDATSRWLTKAQMNVERDIGLPIRIEEFANQLRVWRETFTYHWQTSLTHILRREIRLKAARGNLQALEDDTLMARKSAAETAFKSCVRSDRSLAERYGDLWDRIAGLAEQRRLHEPRARFQISPLGMVDMAITIVRAFDPAETEKQRSQARKEIEDWGTGGGGIPNGQYRDVIADQIARARGWLPENDPYVSKVLGGRSGGEFLDAVIGPGNAGHRNGPEVRTLVHYHEQRDALVKSGWEGIQRSEDPAIVAARELVILMRQNQTLSDELDAREEALGAELARAMFACYGTELSPDATGTPRFTDGIVRGFRSGGTSSPHRTTFSGLYARNAELGDGAPFTLPKLWLDRRDRIDMTKPINFVSTNDISMGNSGSVVVNKELEVVGVVVDGNIESLSNDFVYRADVPRTVSVHVDGIMESLVKIYDAHHVARELTGSVPSSKQDETGR